MWKLDSSDVEIIDEESSGEYALNHSHATIFTKQTSTPRRFNIGRRASYNEVSSKSLVGPILKFADNTSTIASKSTRYVGSTSYESIGMSNTSDDASGASASSSSSLSFDQAYQNHLKCNIDMRALLDERYRHYKTRMALEKIAIENERLMKANIAYKKSSKKQEKKIYNLQAVLNEPVAETVSELPETSKPKLVKRKNSVRFQDQEDKEQENQDQTQDKPLLTNPIYVIVPVKKGSKKVAVKKAALRRNKVSRRSKIAYQKYAQIKRLEQISQRESGYGSFVECGEV